MTIKVRIICIFATMLALLGAIIVTMGLNSAAQKRVADAQLNRLQSNKLADQLRQSSDDLTRMARTYAVTGDATYEQYFFDILAIRDGTAPRPHEYHEIYWDFVTSSGERPTSLGRPAALMDLMKQIGLSGEELAKLEEAKKSSDDLTKLEKEAFGAMKGLFADDLGNLTVRREPDPEFAREILHSSEYHKAKAEIMRPIGEFMKLIDERMHRELEAIQTQEVFFSTTASVLTVATLLFSIFAFFHIKRRAVDPVVSLADIAQRIEHGHSDERATITISSSDELGGLYRAFNSMVDRTQDAIAELAGVNAELNVFVYSVAHDLRAPLRSMDGFSHVLLEDYGDMLDDEGREYLGRIRRSSQQMAQLIDGLLALSRVTRREMKRAPVDLSALARSIADELQRAEPGRAVEFVVEQGLTVDGDTTLLTTVLENLLGNAWKFTSKQAKAQIDLGTIDHEGGKAYFVRDDGAGFDMAYADKLFGAF